MKLKLFKKDVLIEPYNQQRMESEIIQVYRENERKDKMNFFKVIDVADNVTMVKPGDVILVQYLKHTIPMLFNDKMCAITSEDDIEAVIEE